MPKLIAIAGPPNSGKMPLAKVLMKKDPSLILVHRDQVRSLFPIDENKLTILMGWIARSLLTQEHNVIFVGQNLLKEDRVRLALIGMDYEFKLMDTRDPEVHKLIPPLEGWKPSQWEGA